MSEDNVCESWEELIKDDNPNGQLNGHSNESDKSSSNTQLDNKLNGEEVNNKSVKKSVNSNKNGSSNKAANSTYSFKNVQIKFEDDNLRNHFVAQIQQHQNAKVKILQRPKKQQDNVKNDIGNDLIKNGFYNAKTFQEREAEYAKARLRILGPNYENEEQIEQQRPFNNQLDRKDENLVRKPQGPTSWNFNR